MAADDDIADTKVNLGVPNIKKKYCHLRNKKNRDGVAFKKKRREKTFLSDTRNFSVNPDYDILLFFCSLFTKRIRLLRLVVVGWFFCC